VSNEERLAVPKGAGPAPRPEPPEAAEPLRPMPAAGATLREVLPARVNAGSVHQGANENV
jgi:hypothetical protein